MHSKITPELEAMSEKTEPLEWLDVTIKLDGAFDKISDVITAKQKFAVLAQPIINSISELGGEVRNRVWINHTLRARLFSEDIAAIAALENVSSVDLAQMIGNDDVYEPGDSLLSDTQYMEPSIAASAADMIRSWRNMPREEFQELARNI